MADIELVIKIPEEIYEASQIIDVKSEDVIQIPLEVIANGIPHETVTEFADRCRECGREKVLDKIRAEIEEQVLESLSDGGDDWFAAEKVNECLEIIDKYKKEGRKQKGVRM